ncbi:transmembrane protein 79 [Cyprinodon tularosa]|uniref:transmembrane protein 79 n=1 Tax=Cyprinodon tularosa TaxID=77115 RepID=UPI0018E212EF|nr:transmembrane protein 79 [Cyprinodon tularosa]XP_038135268.1 transmembrane protein 79 [Cyprinodon tularosa]
MADQGGTVGRLNDLEVSKPDDSNEKPKTAEGQKPQDSDTTEGERTETTDEEEEDDEDEEEEEEEMAKSAHFEATTLPYPGDLNKKLQLEQKEDLFGSEERDTGISQGESQDLSEERSQEEVDGRNKWRESMPEGERWRDDEIELQRHSKEDGSLADDEHEDDEEEADTVWISEKPSMGFTPHVMIVCPNAKEQPEENRDLGEQVVERQVPMEYDPAAQFSSEWEDQPDEYYVCGGVCSEKLGLVLSTVAGALLFPLLVWAGYALLPFDYPHLESPPLRVLYTLRCSFFAIIPIILGVMVQGIARLRFSALKPLYQGNLVNKEVMVHWHYVNESLSLFLFYFLQLAVMGTYISQDLVKLVPLLSIIFVFGRLIYWLCLSLESSIRGFGFGFSFFPILVMLGANLYFVCASVGQGSVFDVAPPATPPPPRLRWWF